MFQSTRPRGARRGLRWRGCLCSASFNPRARVGRDRSMMLSTYSIRGFNPRARVGRDGGIPLVGMQLYGFQSTRPRGARHYTGKNGFLTFLFQSTRPRGARPQIDSEIGRKPAVSIHAPAWGATSTICCLRRAARVSIHAPAWGATITDNALLGMLGCFNPRARVGRDRGCSLSARGLPCFNPRARVGRDALFFSPKMLKFMFQSTRPRGARPAECMRRQSQQLVSIHAPAWGATRMQPHGMSSAGVSIHAPAWGATEVAQLEHGIECCFNPRARVGRDLGGAVANSAPSGSFNPRARVGRDRHRARGDSKPKSFNPRARVGRDSIRAAGLGI